MKQSKYNIVKRMIALTLFSALIVPTMHAQKALHLFYKSGTHEKIVLEDDANIAFIKKPYIELYYYGNDRDTIYIDASTGRTWEFGWVTANEDWEAVVDVDWLVVRRDKLAEYQQKVGDGMICTNCLFYFEGNDSDEARTAKVTFKTKKSKVVKEVVVIQNPYTISLEPIYDGANKAVTTKKSEMRWNDTVYYSVAFPNFGVELTQYPDWMTLDTLIYHSEGFTLDKVAKVPDSIRVTHESLCGTYTDARFSYEKNNKAESRTGEIIFEGRGQKAVISITQEGLNEQTISNEVEALIKEMYRSKTYPNSHIDYGYPSLMLGMDSRGNDLVTSDNGYNRYIDALMYSDINENYNLPTIYWNALYAQIVAANKVIADYEDRSEESLFQFYLGQAYALRAFNYFYLAQIYQQTYVGNEEKPCVPIITKSDMSSYIYTDGHARASVNDVYEYILQNLDIALDLLEKTEVKRQSKQYINKEVVHGLRARVNMVMNRWQEAAADAQYVVNAKVAKPYTREEVSQPTFADINHDSWLWGIDVKEDDAIAAGVANWPSHMGTFSFGYAQAGAWRKISLKLYDEIPATDVRKGWFLDGYRNSANLTKEYTDYINNYGVHPYTQVKFAPYNNVLDTRMNANDIPLMRIEEMYLILAEAKAMSGEAEAANILNDFVTTYRDPEYVCTATTHEELREAIWWQRRVELWGEGHSYFDIMRMKKGIDRRGADFGGQYIFNIPAGDASLIYPIPNNEIENNPLLEQNPTAKQPTPVEDIKKEEK